MKSLLFLAALLLSLTAGAQDKKYYNHYNKLTDLKGTDYVIASVFSLGKAVGNNDKYLLFINTKTGESQMAALPDDCYIDEVEQVRIDSLQLNVVVLNVYRSSLDGKNAGPKQLIVLSTDGKQMKKITDDRCFAQASTINHQTGHIVVAGHYDSNSNGKRDKTDRNEIVIYDLKAMKEVSKF